MTLDESLAAKQQGHAADHEALRVEAAGRGVTITPITSKASHKLAHNELHANHNLIGAPTSLPQDPTTGHLAHHGALHAAYNTRITPMPDPVGQSAGVWTGVWRDEFDTGTKPDTAVWADHLIEGAEHRTNWNVDEVQWYTHDKRGLSIASSILTLTARHESPYTADPLCPNPLPSGNVGTYTSGAIQSIPVSK